MKDKRKLLHEMRKKSGGLASIGKVVTKASLRRSREPIPNKKLLKSFHVKTASAEVLVKKWSVGIQGRERESFCCNLPK